MKIVHRLIRPAFAIAVAFISVPAFGGLAAPVGLLVNGVRSPLAIDRDTTRFTWQDPDTNRGAEQMAYQIIISDSANGFAAGNADWWDSGKVDSDQSASVEYAGKALPPTTRFWWKVRIWDKSGKAGPYSAPAFFDTGLNNNEWTAKYIWDGTKNLNNFAYFRKVFVVNGKPSLAKVYVTAHNDYLLYFNGQLLGRGPARSDPYHYGQYNSYDITKLVKPGTNVFAAMAHWLGTWNDSGIDAKPEFRLEARLDYADGSAATIGTDASWKVLAHTPFIETNPTYFSTLTPKLGTPPKHRENPPYMWTIPADNHQPSEYIEGKWGYGGGDNRAAIQFDSRQEPVGWKRPGFDDSKWAPATVVDRSNYHLFAQMAPLEREQAELKPVSITQAGGGWLVDFGRCIDGWPKLTMHSNRSGDVVRVEYFQMTGGQKPAGWDEYICHGGAETWDADFGRHTSFQVLKITGYAGQLNASDVRGIWAYSDADVAGRFDCSSPLVNRIYKMCVRSAQQNIQQGFISVDANREQSQWTADSWNIGNVLLYNDRDTMMMDKVVRDYAGEQMSNGDFPTSCPGQVTSLIAEWSMYWPMLLWQQYLFSGDKTLLHEMSPRLIHFLQWVKPYQNPATKLLNFPGWRITDYAGGNTPNGGYNVATASQYYDDLRIASRIFSVMGQSKQSKDYLWQAEEVKQGINSHLFNGRYYLARIDRKGMFPLASAWALRFDIEPEDSKSKILAVIGKDGTFNLGGYGGDALYSGLLNAGGGDLVIHDLRRYLPMLETNKANWESFFNPPRNEVNHAWTSYPGYILLKYIAGIQPTSGGFATFDVRPDIEGLSFAEGTVPTVKGLISTRWEKHGDGKLTLSVSVPANTRATIYIPKLAQGDFMIRESGKLLWPGASRVEDPGVIAVSEENDAVRCVVGAGKYRFNEAPGNP